MKAPHDPDRRDREALERAERGALGLAIVLALMIALRVGQAWAEGRL